MQFGGKLCSSFSVRPRSFPLSVSFKVTDFAETGSLPTFRPQAKYGRSDADCPDCLARFFGSNFIHTQRELLCVLATASLFDLTILLSEPNDSYQIGSLPSLAITDMDPKDLPPVLWTHPNPRETQMTEFMLHIEEKYKVQLETYQDLHNWSINCPSAFWEELWRFLKVKAVLSQAGQGLIQVDPLPHCTDNS